MFTIRPAQPEDRDAFYRICLETGDSGQDGTRLYEDPELLGHVYAGPYLQHQPEFAFVIEDEQGVCGYVIGALDSREFAAVLEREWWPELREKYPEPTGPREERTPDQHMMNHIHHPYGVDESLMVDYPSHLHIDLLPRAQGGGRGKALMFTLLRALKAAGSPGVHLGVGGKNVNAQGFYRHIGFKELRKQADNGYLMGWNLLEDLPSTD